MRDRIELILRIKKLTQKDFAQKIGKSPQYINSILTGKGSIGLDFINHLVDVVKDVNLNWLITGKGEMLINYIKNYETQLNDTNSQVNEPYGNNNVLKDRVRELEDLVQRLNGKIELYEKWMSELFKEKLKVTNFKINEL